MNGNIVIERSDENKRYYGHAVKAKEILLGGAVAIPESAQILTTVIEAAEGKQVDLSSLPSNIDIAPSDESSGAKNEEELAEINANSNASDANSDGTITNGTSPNTSPRRLPSVGSPRAIDPEHPEELIRKPSISSTPPPRPPRRFVGSPSNSPRNSSEINRETMESQDGQSRY